MVPTDDVAAFVREEGSPPTHQKLMIRNAQFFGGTTKSETTVRLFGGRALHEPKTPDLATNLSGW